MKKIIKISENTYLVDGTYITNNFNEAVIKANETTIILSFKPEKIELSFLDKIKYFFDRVLDCFEVVDPDNYI